MVRKIIDPIILQTAESLFSRNGYVSTSLEDIASEAQVDLADLELDKEELLWISATSIADEFKQALAEVLSVPRPVDDRLRYAIMAHINVIARNLDAANVYMHEWRYLSDDLRTEYLNKRDDYEAQFRTIIHQGIHDGMFSPIDEKFVTLSLLSSLNWVSQWYRPEGSMSPDDIARTLADLTLNGLYRHV